MAIPLWRDVAVILLIIELMIVMLPFLVLFYVALKGMLHFNRFMRGLMPQIRGVFLSIQHGTGKAAGVVTTPVIAAYSYRAFGRGVIQGTISVMKGRSG